MNYEQIVDKCKELRANAERASAEYFLFLMEVEREHLSVLEAAGIYNFDAWLRANHFVDVDRYRLFVIGVETVGVEKALELGVHFVIEAAKIRENPSVIRALAKRARDFVKVNRFAPSAQAAREWRLELSPAPEKEHGTAKAATELQRLRAENENLRAELKVAKTENTSLKSRIKDLEKQLGSRGGQRRDTSTHAGR